MSSNNRTLIDKIHAKLSTDETLSGYVKSFTKGDMNTARMLFPFVSVGNLSYTLQPHSTVYDKYIYTVEILAGTHSIAPGVAFRGTNDGGKKGILQLCGDITAVLRNNTLDNFLTIPISEIQFWHGKGKKSSYSLWLCTISLKAVRLQMRAG